MKQEIADSLRGWRGKHRMTQREVAEAIGVTMATIGNYEAGIGCISYENAWKLADLYGVTLDELGGRDERKAD